MARGKSAYIFFVIENRSRVIGENPALKKDIAAVGKRLGEMWRALSDAEKQPYYKMAADDKARAGSLPKEIKKPSPLRKPNSYMKFVQQNRVSVANGSLSVTEVAKKLGQMWRSLSNAEKQRYA